MFLRTLPASSNYIVRIQLGLCPSTVSSVLLKSSQNMSISTTTSSSTKNISTDSFGFAPPKSPASQTKCNICKRLLYSFEEILICRVCHDSYHWRCVKPETISHYGENTNFICETCNETDSLPTPTHRLSNGGIRIKSPDSSETGYRHFTHISSKLTSNASKDPTTVNTVRYFEEKQPPLPVSSVSSPQKKFEEHHTVQTNGQYIDDTKTTHRLVQQAPFESDEENTTSGMFQANYQYTPLKEYAATKNEINTNGYRSSPSPSTDRQFLSRYNGGLGYTNRSPINHPTQFSSPTIDNLSLHNRQQHFTSTTNLNVMDTTARRQQLQTTYRNSTPYLAQVRDDDCPTFQTSYYQTDRHSNVESDSGIVITNSNHQQETPTMEKKLTDLVQQLTRQLETDAQKLNEKLELKLKNLEYMIHQQTYVIRRQDEVIERLKSKISKIEDERDHFRNRLSLHEQREFDEKKDLTSTETDDTLNRKMYEQDDQQQTLNDISTNRKFSTTSSVTTEHSRRSNKKTPAPRIDQSGSIPNHENESTISKLIKTIPTNQEDHVPDVSSTVNRLTSSVPLIERSAASTRLDDIIRQTEPSPTSYYGLNEIRQQESKQTTSMEEQQILSTIHQDDERKSKRSSSSSSSSSSTTSSSTFKSAQANKSTLSSLPPKTSHLHRSLESLPRQTTQPLNPTNKATSLEFGKRPVDDEDPGSIYVIPQEATHPASQYRNTVKGWLRKQNRNSFFKRIERYYCVLKNNTLLMHKHDADRKPQKVINLQGAKVVFYDDTKHGPTLELSWTTNTKAPKRYHLYLERKEEAEQWLQGIQTAINSPATQDRWQRYRMQT